MTSQTARLIAFETGGLPKKMGNERSDTASTNIMTNPYKGQK
jgi:hypothetical protein